MLFVQILITSLVTGTQVLLLAAGLYLVYTIAKTFHIALGAMAMVGAYGFYAANQWQLPWWICCIAGLGAAFVAGLLSSWLLYPFVNKNQTLIALLMSVTFGVFLEALLAFIFGSEGRFLIATVLPTFEWNGLRITQVGVWTLFFGALIALSAWVLLYVLPYGRVVRAVAQHKECASLLGIQQKKVQWKIFGIVSLLAGTIGILIGMQNAVTPGSGLHPIIMAFMALLVGGVNDFRGTVVAAYLLSLLPEILVSGAVGIDVSTSWKMVFVFMLALIFLLIKPFGLFSKNTRLS